MAIAKVTKNVMSDEDVENLEDNKAELNRRAKPATVYLLLNNEQTGPFTRAQVLEMVELGTIESETMYWEDGMEDWQSLDYM